MLMLIAWEIGVRVLKLRQPNPFARLLDIHLCGRPRQRPRPPVYARREYGIHIRPPRFGVPAARVMPLPNRNAHRIRRRRRAGPSQRLYRPVLRLQPHNVALADVPLSGDPMIYLNPSPPNRSGNRVRRSLHPRQRRALAVPQSRRHKRQQVKLPRAKRRRIYSLQRRRRGRGSRSPCRRIPPAPALQHPVPKRREVRRPNRAVARLIQLHRPIPQYIAVCIARQSKIQLQPLRRRQQNVREIPRPKLLAARLKERPHDRLLKPYHPIPGPRIRNVAAPILQIVMLRQNQIRHRRGIVHHIRETHDKRDIIRRHLEIHRVRQPVYRIRPAHQQRRNLAP